MSSRSWVTSPMMRIARPGPGERLAPDHVLGEAELLAHHPHLVLEELAQRLDQLDHHVVGEAADVVVALDLGGVARARLDDVGVERALHQEAGVRELVGLALEDADELAADRLALLLRLGDPAERGDEVLLGAHVDERHPEVAAEGLLHLLALVQAHQAVVDEDAGEPVADRLVHDQRRHRAVDAAREAADRARVADLGAHPLDLLLDDVGGGPRGRSSRRPRRGTT